MLIKEPIYAYIGLILGIVLTHLKGYYFALFLGISFIILWVIIQGVFLIFNVIPIKGESK